MLSFFSVGSIRNGLKGFRYLGTKVKKEEFRDILSSGYLWKSPETHFRI